MSLDPKDIASRLRSGIATAPKATVSAQPSVPKTGNDVLFATGRYRNQKGRLIYGVRLENTTGGHNKEYTITVTGRPLAHSPQVEMDKNAGAMEFFVEASYGKIAGTLTTIPIKVDGNVSSNLRSRALSVAKNQEQEKRSKGYVVTARREDGSAFDDLADESAVFDVTDDKIVQTSDPVAPSPRKTVDEVRRCFCMEMVEELAISSWAEPIPADASVPPLLFDPAYAALKFEESDGGIEPYPRWIIAVLDSCESGYRHARATPVGEDMSEQSYGPRRRVKAGWIEDRVIDALDKSAGMVFTAKGAKRNVDGTLDFIIVVEQQMVDQDRRLVAFDALRWNAEDLVETPWQERRQILESNFDKIFDKTAKYPVLLSARVNDSLRESYLANGHNNRYEILRRDALPTDAAFRLPQL